MTLRCNCSDAERAVVDGGWRDPFVFGSCRTCQPESAHADNISAELDRLERPNLSAAIREHAEQVAPMTPDAWPHDLELREELTLDADERGGR